MSEQTEVSSGIWVKIERGLTQAGTEEEPAVTAADVDNNAKRRRKTQRMVCDIFATIFWTYVVMKVFIGDIDVAVGRHYGHWLTTLIAYRFLVLVAFLVMLGILARKSTLIWLVYIALFPFVVILWKVPKFYVKRRSWMLVVGSVHLLSVWIKSIKWSLVFGGLLVLASAAILFSAPSWLLAASATILVLVWFVACARAFFTGLQPSRFVQGQRKLAEGFLGTGIIRDQVGIKDEIRDSSLPALSAEQTKEVLQNVSNGLMLHRFMLVVTHQLDRYRRSGAFIVFSALSVLLLLLQAIWTFGFVNAALWQISPEQFETSREPSFVTFFYYAFATMAGNETGVMAPVGGWAMVVALTAAISSGFLLLVLIVTVIFSVRKSRTDESSRRAIDDLRSAVERVESELGAEYEMSLDEVFERLQAMEWGTVGMIQWLSQQAGGRP